MQLMERRVKGFVLIVAEKKKERKEASEMHFEDICQKTKILSASTLVTSTGCINNTVNIQLFQCYVMTRCCGGMSKHQFR